MRPTIFVSFSVCMMLAAGLLHASTETHSLQPSAPRTVTVSEAETPPQIRAGLLQSTLLVLPNEEKVANVFAGDTVNWIFDGGHVASRFISVKPKTANAATDIHIVSDHGNEYTLALREVSDDSDPHFDSKVFIAPGDQAAKDRLAQLPVFVPVAELDKAKQEVAAAKPRRQKLSSTAANIPARCTSTSCGTSAREKSLDSSKSGATTSSPTCVDSSKRRPHSTS